MARLVLPAGLEAADSPYVPEVRRLYWLEHVLLDPADPEERRPAVVMVIAQRPAGEILVGLRSSTERNGEQHDRYPELGLSKVGWFSRARSINPELWTPNNAHSIDLLLDEITFSYVVNDLVSDGLG